MKPKILIVGDVCLDNYWHGSVKRISAEAPIPILDLENSTIKLGMAANVALNIKTLDCYPILISVGSGSVRNEIEEFGIECHLVNEENRSDTIKNRFLSGNHQLLRMDEGTLKAIDSSTEDKIISYIESNPVDVAILQDYGKGVVTPDIIQSLRKNSNKLLIDPASSKHARFYNYSPYAIFPNRIEAESLCESKISDGYNVITKELHDKTGTEHVVLKLSENGIMHSHSDTLNSYSSLAKNVVDVTGAGDTVIAVVGACLSKGMNIQDSLVYASKAAALVVEQIGNISISWNDIDKI